MRKGRNEEDDELRMRRDKGVRNSRRVEGVRVERRGWVRRDGGKAGKRQAEESTENQ